MDGARYKWTLRDKAKVSIPVLFAVLLALQNSSCSAPYDYSIRNHSAVTVQFGTAAAPCHETDLSHWTPKSQNTLTPDESNSDWNHDELSCVVVTDMNGQFLASHTYKEWSIYELTESGLEFELAIVDRSDVLGTGLGGLDFISLILAVPFYVAFVIAMVIASRNLYQWARRRLRRANSDQ